MFLVDTLLILAILLVNICLHDKGFYMKNIKLIVTSLLFVGFADLYAGGTHDEYASIRYTPKRGLEKCTLTFSFLKKFNDLSDEDIMKNGLMETLLCHAGHGYGFRLKNFKMEEFQNSSNPLSSEDLEKRRKNVSRCRKLALKLEEKANKDKQKEDEKLVSFTAKVRTAQVFVIGGLAAWILSSKK